MVKTATPSLWFVLPLLASCSIILAACTQETAETTRQGGVDLNHETYRTWKTRGGSYASIRYSSLDQIHRENVSELEVAWIYQTGDVDPGDRTEIQNNPIKIGSTLYVVSPKLKIIALNPATGEEQWVFDPHDPNVLPEQESYVHRNRGLTFWESDDGSDRRLIYTVGPYLLAVNADDGSLIQSFGEGGIASFRQGLGERKERSVFSSSPGVVYGDLYISGSTVGNAAPGHIRAFSVLTGELEWVFHTIPQPGEFGHDTWDDPDAWRHIGHANAWSGLTLDEERGIVFAPTGSASSDFYGGFRTGSNLFANTVLALDAATGERIWHFQTIRHDLWDYDLPAQPSLVTVQHNGKWIDAVSQTTKTGFVFLLDRETGEPLFPVEERPVPTETALTGEQVWPTQPYPTRPEPFVRQEMSEEDINPFVPEEEQEALRRQLQSLHSDHMFDPPSLEGTLVFPGFDGGSEWGGTAFDPETGILYVNSNEVPWTMTMVPSASLVGEVAVGSVGEISDADAEGSASLNRGREIYMSSCVACHGPDREGGGNNPSLVDVDERLTPGELMDIINSGRNMMPAFSHLPDPDKEALVNYLVGEEYFALSSKEQEIIQDSRRSNAPYIFTGHKKFRTSEGYPANTPPWGTLNAINLNTGEYAWRVPLGEYPSLKARGIEPTGTENYGGPVVTAGGVVFIAATLDEKIRAFDKSTGDLLWEHDLPAAGYATPSVYEAAGKQFVVIAAGGGKLGTPSGDGFVAFALPERYVSCRSDSCSARLKFILLN